MQDLADRINELVAKHVDVEKITREAERLAAIGEREAERIAEKVANLNFDQLGSEFRSFEHFNYNLEDAAFQQEKSIQKKYTVTKKRTLLIDNRFGKVDVQTWNKNEIHVDIKVRVGERSASRATDLLNGVTVDEQVSSDQIQLKTNIQSSLSRNSGNGNKGLEINYTVHMPANTNLKIANKYGAVSLPDLSGAIEMDVSYGSLTAGKLSAPGTRIQSAYGSAKISELNSAALNVKYGSLDLGSVRALKLDLSYCGGSNIVHIGEEADITMKYSGGFKAGISSGLKKLNLDAAYSPAAFSIADKGQFKFMVDLSYGSFSEGKGTIVKEDPDPSSRGPRLHRTYQGYYGNSNSKNTVNINSKYGSISFR